MPKTRAHQHVVRAVWFSIGVIMIVLAVVGAVLPIMPTTVFVIMAAFAFGKSSPAIEAYLLNHRYFGPIIQDWRKYGAIAPKYKAIAIGAMLVTVVSALVLGAPQKVIIIQLVCIGLVAIYILTRPSGRVDAD